MTDWKERLSANFEEQLGSPSLDALETFIETVVIPQELAEFEEATRLPATIEEIEADIDSPQEAFYGYDIIARLQARKLKDYKARKGIKE